MSPVPVRSIDALIAEDPGALDDAELKDHLCELARARARLDAAEAEAIAEFDARSCFAADGALNAASWLAHHTGITRASAGGRVSMAKRLRRTPLLMEALRAGEVTDGHVRAMGRCITPRTLDALARDEAMLVGHAIAFEADDFEKVVTRWLYMNDPDGPNPNGERPSELRVSALLDGWHAIDGQFNLEDSAEYFTELDAIYEELWQADQRADDSDPNRMRTRAQRYAAAQVQMARRSSAAGDRDEDPDDGMSVAIRRTPRRPLLIVHVDVDALAGKSTGRAELADGTQVGPEILERWMCDSSVGRVVMKGGSVPIDLGKVTYIASDGQRRALAVRDRGCIVPGCKRKPRWCQAHHVVPWPNGPTDLKNLVLLCHRHHKQVHAKIIELVPGEREGRWVVVRGVDGQPLKERPPPVLAA